MCLSFTIAAGPRHRSHSWVRVPQDSWSYFTVSDSRLPQSGGPGPHIYIPQEQGGPVIPPGTGLLGSDLGWDTVQCFGCRQIVYEHLKIKVYFIHCLLSVLILVQMRSEKISGSFFFQEKGDEPISVSSHIGPNWKRVGNYCFKHSGCYM
jgi:hypothetical protein